MRELSEEQALERLRRRLPAAAEGAPIVERRPDEYWLSLTCETRAQALGLFAMFRAPEDIAIMRFARAPDSYRIKPLELVTDWERGHAAQLIDGCHPLIWRLDVAGRASLEWWHMCLLGRELASRVLVNAVAHIHDDPAHYRPAYRKGGRTMLPRGFPHGEVCTVSRETSTDRVVWFPTRGPTLAERLGVA